MRQRDIHNTAAVIIVYAFAIMEVLPAESSSQEAARLRCQKSGCREGLSAAEEPTLIVASPTNKAFPLITTWIAAFLVLRFAAHYIRKLLPIIRREAPEIRAAVGDYFNSMVLAIGGQRVKQGRRYSTRSSSSNRSLGSLAELLDDSGRSGRGASLWYDNDSSSAGYSSAFTSYNSDSNNNDYDNKSSAVESQSEVGLSVFSSESSTGSVSYTYSHNNNNDDDQSRGGESIVSKFLNYISESKGRGHGVKRRSTLDHSLRHSNNTDTDGFYNSSEKNRTNSHKRRSTVDDMNHSSYRRSQHASTEINHQRRESSNAPESLLIAQSKPSSGGVKMRKTPAAAKAKSKSQDYKSSDDNGKTKSKSQQHQQQQPIQRHGKEKSKKNSSLHHHLSKFSSSNNEDDNEHYSTMLSTVDLRSRVTGDTRATWDSGSFVGK